MSDVISFLKARGFIDQITSEDLPQIFSKPRKVYIGFDPTADSLHLGNLVGIIAARWFQKFGHTPIILVGGGTGRIGDPSGKSNERPLLSEEILRANVAGIHALLEGLLDFSDEKVKPIIVNNDDWLSKFSLVDFLRDVGKHFRMSGMLSKESVKARLQSEEGMSFTEFTYQMLQGYDFSHLNKNYDVILQIGGSDQWGNITAGTEFSRKLSGTSLYGMTFPLLTRSDGKKFGKSEGGAIWLDSVKCSPYNFYQYFMNVPDRDVIKMFRMLTFLSEEEISAIESCMSIPNSAQKRLAQELTRFVHGSEALMVAESVTKAAAPGSDAALDLETLERISNDFPKAILPLSQVEGEKYIELICKIGLLSSKSEATRLIKNRGAYLNNKKVEDPTLVIEKEHLIGDKYLVFSAGKKKKLLLEIES